MNRGSCRTQEEGEREEGQHARRIKDGKEDGWGTDAQTGEGGDKLGKVVS